MSQSTAHVGIFAAHALTGLLTVMMTKDLAAIARESVKLADAMLEALDAARPHGGEGVMETGQSPESASAEQAERPEE